MICPKCGRFMAHIFDGDFPSYYECRHCGCICCDDDEDNPEPTPGEEFPTDL